MNQRLDIQSTGHRQIVTIHGDLDLAVADEVRTALESGMAPGSAVEVDCSQVGVVDRHGLGSLICAHYLACDMGADFELRHVPPAMRRALQAAGISGLFPENDGPAGSEERAVAHSARRRPAARVAARPPLPR